jgi:hypothetical protein
MYTQGDDRTGLAFSIFHFRFSSFDFPVSIFQFLVSNFCFLVYLNERQD